MSGTLGTAAAGNIPQARYQATTWTGNDGSFWLFGGDVDSENGGSGKTLNDLWKFTPTTNEWAWMAGSTASDQPGTYGTIGMRSAQNTPGSREGASSWTDSNGILWLFGGRGLDANGKEGVLNDLWEFNPTTSNWTWISGSSTAQNCFGDGGGGTNCSQSSTYGTVGTPATGNTPGSREGAITWTDNNGNLWLFGGWSFDVPNDVQYYFDELWKYSIAANQWAWMGGSSTKSGSTCVQNVNLWYYTCGETGVYGTLGTPAPANIPGGRSDALTWTDSSGDVWLFSGFGFDSIGYLGDPQDLWNYSPTTNQWTWMGGSSALSPAYPCDPTEIGGACSGPPVFGALGVPAAGNIPGGRDHAVGWKDSNGNFWLYGGGVEGIANSILNADSARNDIWEFIPSQKQWALMGGSIESLCGIYCASSPDAIYGTLSVSAPGNNPGVRYSPSGWTDRSGNFWLFGGEPSPFEGLVSLFENDMWEYQPSGGPLPTTASPSFGTRAGSYASAQSVTMIDATNGAYIYYTTDGTTPTIQSNVFFPSLSQPITISYSQTLKAIAVAPGCLDSAITTAVYTLPPRAAAPTLILPSGTYTSFQTLTISDTTPGATIYYTTNGSAPTTSSTVYTGPISDRSASLTLQAVAIAANYSISDVATANYTLNLPQAAAPTFSVATGTYNTSQTVTLSDATPGATIYYQINTGYPTTSSPIYNGPLHVSSSEIIWAMATAPDYFPSASAGANYTIDPQALQTAAPSFNVPAGTYASVQTVTVSDTASGAFIYYTTDGSTPTTSSSVYTNPISISSSETLRAIALLSGDISSSVTSAVYTINLPAAEKPAFSLAGGSYNGLQTVTLSDPTPGADIYYTTDGTAPTPNSTFYSGAITVSASETIEAIATASGYANSAVAFAAYTINPLAPTYTFAASSTSLAVNSGAQGSTTLTVMPQNGFNAAVSFACSGLPANATCSFNPTTITPSGAAATTLLTIAVSAQATLLRRGSPMFLPTTALAVASCFFVCKRRRSLGGALMVLIMLLVDVGLLSGCGNGHTAASSGGATGSPQTYIVTMTATSGTIQQKATVTLIEN